MASPVNTSVDELAVRINGRHAFVHERVLEFIVRETDASGAVSFEKGTLAAEFGCCVRSVDRAITRLRRQGYIESEPMFSPTGAQKGNRYRATKLGAEHLKRRERVERLVGEVAADAARVACLATGEGDAE